MFLGFRGRAPRPRTGTGAAACGYGGGVTDDRAFAGPGTPDRTPSHPEAEAPRPLRFAIIGDGAIAQEILRLVDAVPGAASALSFVGHVTRSTQSLTEALTRAELIVEAAGVGAVSEHGPRIVGAGRDLVVASIGAFADPALLPRLRSSGTGRVHLTSGAIGGLDLLAAAGRTGGLDGVKIQSRKLPDSLVQPWMEAEQRAHLAALRDPELLFSGTAEEAIERFPSSLNVAVAVQLAAGPDVPLVVELIADPAAALTEHEISASGDAGEYALTIRNAPLEARPASSGLTARALVGDLIRIAAQRRGERAAGGLSFAS